MVLFVRFINSFLDTGCGHQIYTRMKTISEMYMKSMNLKTREKIWFKRLNFWTKQMAEKDQSMINKKSLSHLLNKTKQTAISNYASLINTLCHMIFFE